MKSQHWSVAAAVVLCSGAACAQSPNPLPAEVEAVVTGGKWQSGSQGGWYRVVVRSGGVEHVVSQAQVDWLAQSEAKGVTVIASTVAPTGSWRIVNARIAKRGGGWVAILEGVEPHFVDQRGTWVLSLGAPGQVTAKLKTR